MPGQVWHSLGKLWSAHLNSVAEVAFCYQRLLQDGDMSFRNTILEKHRVLEVLTLKLVSSFDSHWSINSPRFLWLGITWIFPEGWILSRKPAPLVWRRSGQLSLSAPFSKRAEHKYILLGSRLELSIVLTISIKRSFFVRKDLARWTAKGSKKRVFQSKITCQSRQVRKIDCELVTAYDHVEQCV